MIIVCQKLLKNTKINGITLYPFILLKKKHFKDDKVLINHEKIHLRQQLELLIIFFYLWYIIEYYYWYFKLKNSFMAYKYISFEREAYAMEDDLNYLETRKTWSFWKYLGRWFFIWAIIWFHRKIFNIFYLGSYFRLPLPIFCCWLRQAQPTTKGFPLKSGCGVVKSTN